ncbi:MAG: hypothetical protein PHF79_03615 [Candidatus Pacebacteria bacterium]|nr:hypothetical protein [Candidatus Paceibacterota bacterium]
MGSLSQIQLAVIIGSLLGDGYIRTIPGRKNSFLEINHSIKQKEYVDWKYEILKEITVSGPKSRIIDKVRTAYRFYTKQLPELTQLEKRFYQNGKKVIPNDLIISPLSLAVWFMDDGSKCRECDVYLNTQQFGLEDQMRLLDTLKAFNIDARLNKDKVYKRIRFMKSSLAQFRNLVKPYIIPSMKYKIEI